MEFEFNDNKDTKVPRLNSDIAKILGEIGIGDLQNLPRKTKKAAKKAKDGKAISSLELARLQSKRRKQKNT
jgi:hypothetical protein